MKEKKEERIEKLIWIDLEMTGLSPENDSILEIATILTDRHLNILATGPVFAIQHTEEQLSNMDDWCKKTHRASGLWERVCQSRTTMEEAEEETLKFLSAYLPPKHSPMCGNSICMDRRFLYRYMPRLESYFHYRHLDVSTVKVLASLWKPKLLTSVKKEGKHEALADILESIDELRVYQEALFKA
jgi:oligoribonuclease